MKFTLPETRIIVAGSVSAALSQSLSTAIILAALVWVGLAGCEGWQQRH